jgi:hypothetical protein
MTNRAQELIKSFYEEEALRKESEITYSDYSVRLNTSDIAMLDVIAKRFGKAAERIASEAISAAVYSMVEALEMSERKNMAKEADELNEVLSKKAAKTNGNADFNEKSVTWVMNDRAITREENKRKKEQEDKSESQEAKAQPTSTLASTAKPAELESKDSVTESSVFENEEQESSSVFAS